MNEVLSQLDELLFSSAEGVVVDSVEVTDTVVRVEARTTVKRAACPGCGCRSGRVHGSYLRFPRDLPTAGKFVVVSLRVPVSRNTLLWLIASLPDPATAAPRVVGVDEYAPLSWSLQAG
ncbi:MULTISPECIES: transposase family protein [unclassified Streptomyces]|uniref:transposase family protein n=1 Tax=unclassified Streptomyces TaxID=2593676 RepID=UPI002E81BE23|nr:transposase family protein [Streptomyces sp. NBC_00589]WTI42062.1 transposase family protein [Streptomyces sp. NBC_00775]WUB24255.1 transposase family protein [Streptomyces sp. NBC_00589]